MKDAGIDGLGMHLEAVSEPVRQRIMPGKAQVPVSRYLSAFEAAVAVFGRSQVSTYILAGLGDSREEILEMAKTLVSLGVYPFVVPPDAELMKSLLQTLVSLVSAAGLRSLDINAGCVKFGACSSLSQYERDEESVEVPA
jgi:radical SAM protein (TIGR04043 family)